MGKVDRLLNIVAALESSPVPLSADDLRTRVPGYGGQSDEAFRRMFERDKDDLRSIGVPIETVSVAGADDSRAAYRIRRDLYELPDPCLSPEELAALHRAATAVRLQGLDQDAPEGAITKLGGTPRRSGSRPVGQVAVPAFLPELFGAILDRHPVTFPYGGQRRHLEPHRLQFLRGHWYLTGHDTDRGALRSFRLDRINGGVDVNQAQTFEAPAEVSGVRLRPWRFGDGPTTTAVVRLDAVAARTVLAEDPELRSAAVQQPDGSTLLTLEVSDPVGLRNFVLSLLDRAELLAPPKWRQDLIDWLRAIREEAH